jgi:sigma-B regulation protein RsbU (phosphoserine phosphatase)
LIDNVLDFARGRLGGGVAIVRNSDEPLEPVFRQVIGELQASWPERVIETHFEIQDPFDCDRGRLAQLLSNILGNALSYGEPDEPVRVFAKTDSAGFELSVSNAGEPIPAVALQRMFQPFARGAVRSDQQGLGLGLYIASEIARAHDGTLTVASTDATTIFTFRMPRNGVPVAGV